MQISSIHQMHVFLLCLIAGVSYGLFFDFQRSIRKLYFAGVLRTTLEDTFFTVICIVATLFLGYHFNNGQLRYYQIMGSLSGALFYAAFLTRYVMKALDYFYRFVYRVIIRPFVRAFKLICIPLKKIFHFLKKVLKKLKLFFLHSLKGVKTKSKRLKKRIKML